MIIIIIIIIIIIFIIIIIIIVIVFIIIIIDNRVVFIRNLSVNNSFTEKRNRPECWSRSASKPTLDLHSSLRRTSGTSCVDRTSKFFDLSSSPAAISSASHPLPQSRSVTLVPATRGSSLASLFPAVIRRGRAGSDWVDGCIRRHRQDTRIRREEVRWKSRVNGCAARVDWCSSFYRQPSFQKESISRCSWSRLNRDCVYNYRVAAWMECSRLPTCSASSHLDVNWGKRRGSEAAQDDVAPSQMCVGEILCLVGRSVGRSVGPSVGRPIGRSIGWSINGWLAG